MPTITRWGEIKDRVKQASGGGCSEEDALIIANEAIPMLLNNGPWLGSVSDVRIKTFQPEFSIPFEYDRAITVEQCYMGDLNMGWYMIEQGSTYIDPALWGDGVLIDKGTNSTERPFYGHGAVVVIPEYAEEVDVVVRIYGTRNGSPVYKQVISNGVFVAQDYEDLAPNVPSTGDYDNLYEVIKPETKGPVRVCAYTPAGQLYRLITLQPKETKAQRRWYKFPEIKILQIKPRSISTFPTGFAIDTEYEKAPFLAGDDIALQGFCPEVFNGLWTVNSVVGSKVYIQAVPAGGWAEPAEQISVFGLVTKAACISCSVLKRFITITDDQSDTIIGNTLAIRQGVRAMWAWDKGNHAEYDKLKAEAIDILKEEITRYGQDPTHTLNRKAQYRYMYDNFPPDSVGYIVSRLCLEIPGGLRFGRSDMLRLFNEAQEYIILSGRFGDAQTKRNYQVGAGGLVILDPDVQSILTAEIGGRRVLVMDRYYDSSTNKGLVGYGIAGPSGYQVGGFMTNGSLAGGQPRTNVLAQQEDIVDEDGCCRAVYRLQPCQAMYNCCVCTMVKLRYLPAKCMEETILITNYVALKMMVEAFIARETKDFGGFESLKNAAFAILDREKRHKRGGAQSRISYPETWTGRYLRGRGR